MKKPLLVILFAACAGSVFGQLQPIKTLGLPKGSLIIMGSGTSPEVWAKFFELAGGKEAGVVIIPTAVDDAELSSWLNDQNLWKNFNKEITKIMHTRSRDTANMDAFVSELKTANAAESKGNIR